MKDLIQKLITKKFVIINARGIPTARRDLIKLSHYEIFILYNQIIKGILNFYSSRKLHQTFWHFILIFCFYFYILKCTRYAGLPTPVANHLQMKLNFKSQCWLPTCYLWWFAAPPYGGGLLRWWVTQRTLAQQPTSVRWRSNPRQQVPGQHLLRRPATAGWY